MTIQKSVANAVHYFSGKIKKTKQKQKDKPQIVIVSIIFTQHLKFMPHPLLIDSTNLF